MKREKKLTLKQEAFCRLYTTQGDTFGNATISYAIAYNYDFASLSRKNELDIENKEILHTSEYDRAYAVCQSSGSQNLLKPLIQLRVQELLLFQFNKDELIDAKLQSIILSGKDADAINAIKHRNDIKQRITKKLDITTLGRPLSGLSDAELEKIAGLEAK